MGSRKSRTTATIDGEKTAQPTEQISITDTVEYSSLTVGQEYTLKGVLMDKSTGEPLLVGEEQVTSEATFTPAEPNGTVDVLFTFDATELEGTSVVVFETLFQGETEISSHEDMEDEGTNHHFHRAAPHWHPPLPWMASTPLNPPAKSPSWDVVAYSGLTPRRGLTRCPVVS